MDHLTPDQIEALREQLDADLDRLERSMRATGESMEPVKLDQTAVGRLSRIDTLQSQGLIRNLQERERARLAQIQGAFRRMAEGRYGLCADCGEAVPFGRLYVMPETPSCASCAAP